MMSAEKWATNVVAGKVIALTRSQLVSRSTDEASNTVLIGLDALIAETGIHLSAVCQPDVLNGDEKAALSAITGGKDAESFLVDRLVNDLSEFAQKRIAAGHTKPVLKLRLSGAEIASDSTQIGGHLMPREENPVMGLRGVARYLHPQWARMFALQCKIIKQLRHVTGDLPIAIVIPFVRTYSDAASVHDLLAEQGLFRGKSGLQVHLMCDLPANAVMADKFLHYFDGVVIDLDHLAQLTLAIDPANDTLDYDEPYNDAVLFLAERTLKKSREVNKHCELLSRSVTVQPKLQRWLSEHAVTSLICSPQ
ncbi:phosphoenolpyruvate-utilizing protein [Photobacterium sp. WH24]|uniref:putative PEP-binding protein n=1 Tax=Photobacterium sp. WH24 TaxID=2827237 RepID=UPI001C44D2D6|nr:putative PEP-binding protein [Photobacterium sp. WH24]MBV7263328.1 phosphoenolpyruvate-utilizing protein [Photobacterium sp. WH24]